MNSAIFALGVGMLFATGTFLVLRRAAHQVAAGPRPADPRRQPADLQHRGAEESGLPPIEDKAAFAGDIAPFVDPLPQALILTAIVISFGITAFIVMLINRRHTIMVEADGAAVSALDPFAPFEHYVSGLDSHLDDYEWLGYALDDEIDDRDENQLTKLARTLAKTMGTPLKWK